MKIRTKFYIALYLTFVPYSSQGIAVEAYKGMGASEEETGKWYSKPEKTIKQSAAVKNNGMMKVIRKIFL